jgi:hypothetical protein
MVFYTNHTNPSISATYLNYHYSRKPEYFEKMKYTKPSSPHPEPILELPYI